MGGELAPVEGSLLRQEAPRLARALAHDVSRGRWQPFPGRRSVARLDKERVVYHFEALDLCVHGVVAEAIARLLAAQLSPCVHSYQKGRSSLLALRSFAKFIRAHARARPDPRTRGLFILRRDVRACGDSIALGRGKPLWAQLRALLGEGAPGAQEARLDEAMSLIENVVRPPLRGESGGVFHNFHGLPTGSPINNVMLNLHLAPLDDALAPIAGGFYARFGDDFLFAHPDADVARAASERVDAEVAKLGLAVHSGKRRNLWLNGAGRACVAADFSSAQEILFLGAAVTSRGTLRLPELKVAELFAELEKRLSQTARLLRAGPPLAEEEALRVLCSVAAEGLDKQSVFAVPHLTHLLEEVDDRAHLHDLELRLATLIVRIARGSRSRKMFRTLSPARLRALGLPSLVLLRARRP